MASLTNGCPRAACTPLERRGSLPLGSESQVPRARPEKQLSLGRDGEAGCWAPRHVCPAPSPQSVFTLGAAAGGLSAMVLNDLLGRKLSLMFSAVPSVAGYALMAGARGLWMLLLGRTLTGFAGGLTAACIPVRPALRPGPGAAECAEGSRPPSGRAPGLRVHQSPGMFAGEPQLTPLLQLISGTFVPMSPASPNSDSLTFLSYFLTVIHVTQSEKVHIEQQGGRGSPCPVPSLAPKSYPSLRTY